MVSKTYYKTKQYCKVVFSISPGQAKVVDIFGLNNDWYTPIPMRKVKNGNFVAIVQLPKGSIHEFKYLYDNTVWANDPSADGEVPNPFGSTNSVLSV